MVVLLKNVLGHGLNRRDDFMGIKNSNLREALLKLKECFVEVNELTDRISSDPSDEDIETFADGYPFAKSFDELTVEVCEWIRNIEG